MDLEQREQMRLSKRMRIVMEREAYWDPVCVFLSDALSFGFALLERMLVLELGTHICSLDVVLLWK